MRLCVSNGCTVIIMSLTSAIIPGHHILSRYDETPRTLKEGSYGPEGLHKQSSAFPLLSTLSLSSPAHADCL